MDTQTQPAAVSAQPDADVTPTGGKLGKWCSHRRDERKAGRLSAERVAALDALGFVWDPLQQAFDSRYRCHRKPLPGIARRSAHTLRATATGTSRL